MIQHAFSKNTNHNCCFCISRAGSIRLLLTINTIILMVVLLNKQVICTVFNDLYASASI